MIAHEGRPREDFLLMKAGRRHLLLRGVSSGGVFGERRIRRCVCRRHARSLKQRAAAQGEAKRWTLKLVEVEAGFRQLARPPKESDDNNSSDVSVRKRSLAC